MPQDDEADSILAPSWTWYMASQPSGIITAEVVGSDMSLVPICMIGEPLERRGEIEDAGIRHRTATAIVHFLNGQDVRPEITGGTRTSLFGIRFATGIEVTVLHDRKIDLPASYSEADRRLDKMLLTQALWTKKLPYAYRIVSCGS